MFVCPLTCNSGSGCRQIFQMHPIFHFLLKCLHIVYSCHAWYRTLEIFSLELLWLFTCKLCPTCVRGLCEYTEHRHMYEYENIYILNFWDLFPILCRYEKFHKLSGLVGVNFTPAKFKSLKPKIYI